VFGGEKWKSNVLLTAFLCPGYVGGIIVGGITFLCPGYVG